MPYANIVDVNVVDKKEAFCRLRDFLCKRNGTYDYSTTGIGWTMFDSIYAVDEDNPQLNDWFVIYSHGESGKEDLFFHISWVSSAITVKGYQAWNPSTNTGSSRYYNSSLNFSFTDAFVNVDFCVHGDLDFIFACVEYSAGFYYGVSFGKLEPPNSILDTDIATCASALDAGSDVSITLDAVPVGWYEGCEVDIRTTHTDNMSTVYMEHIVIKTISGNTVTADLSYNYTAGARLSSYNCYVCQSGGGVMSQSLCMFTPAESINNLGNVLSIGLSTSYTDPCDFENRYVLCNYVFQAQTTGWPMGIFKHIMNIGVITSPLVPGDRVIDQNGDYWRIYNASSSKYLAVKEV